MALDEFTNKRLDDIAADFVTIYEKVNPLYAAKMLYGENVVEAYLPEIKARIHREFLRRGYTFPDMEEENAVTN